MLFPAWILLALIFGFLNGVLGALVGYGFGTNDGNRLHVPGFAIGFVIGAVYIWYALVGRFA